MTINITEAQAVVVAPAAEANVRITSASAILFTSADVAKRNVSAVMASVLGNLPGPGQHVTACFLNVLSTRTPNYDWVPMIFPDVFPNDISYNSVGTIRFATDVTVVDSGDDQRTRRWDQPLMEFDIAYGVRTMEQLQALIAFFRAMRGRLYAFLYRDPMDFTSSVATVYEARRAPPITPLDQRLGVGDGASFTFRLAKTYAVPTSGTALRRPIVRPEPGSVIIAVDGSVVNNWTIDTDTGIVTFTPPLQVTASIRNNGDGTFTDMTSSGLFHAFDGLGGKRLVVANFADPANNGGLTDKVITIVGVSTNGNILTAAYSTGGTVVETATATFSLHPAPFLGKVVTAGFRFYVPCRFDTDSLPLTLEDYGIGSAQAVKLIEVRPTAF